MRVRISALFYGPGEMKVDRRPAMSEEHPRAETEMPDVSRTFLSRYFDSSFAFLRVSRSSRERNGGK